MKNRTVHFTDGLGPVCGTRSEHAIGSRSPAFPAGVSCVKCVRKMRLDAKSITDFMRLVASAKEEIDELN